jgi:competence protein ComEA
VPDQSPSDDAPADASNPLDAWQERLSLLAGRRPFEPARAAAAVGALLVVVVVAVMVLRTPTPAPAELALPIASPQPAAPETTTTTAAPDVVVHAAGEVAAPGVYTLAPGSRVADLLAAAGGAATGADLSRVNLAAALADGQRVYVPAPEEVVPTVDAGTGSGAAPGGGGPDGSAEAAAPLVDINTASATELEELPGVGPATSAAIIAERDRRGRFSTVDDLLDVRGIGDAKLAAVRDLVVVS